MSDDPVQRQWIDLAPDYAAYLALPPARRGPGLVLLQEISHGQEIANRLRSGMTAINSAMGFTYMPSMPFGGVGHSGFGRKLGDDGSGRSPALTQLPSPKPAMRTKAGAARAKPSPACARRLAFKSSRNDPRTDAKEAP